MSKTTMPVTGSSQLRQLHYDSETETLIATFTNGSCYQYDGVEDHVFEALRDAVNSGGSVGSTFNQLVKNGGYPYTRIG